MIERQRITTYGIATTAVATVVLALWLKPWAHDRIISDPPPPLMHPVPSVPAIAVDPPPPPIPQMAEPAHRVDLVFAVDTTGSMGGLLDGAKRTVWSIASHVRQVDPNADLRVGLVAYKDLGDVYVTKDLALTDNLDAVFAELSSYTAAGGGDEPEDVDAALFDAVHKMAWRADAQKMIFLVGDAPPATRGDVPAYDVTARAAAAQQIALNAIRCGDSPSTEKAWKKIASIGGGEFSSIAEDGGVHQVATPYDEKLAELARTVDGATTVYGDANLQAEYGTAVAATAAAPAAVAADRAAYYVVAPKSASVDHDITDDVASGKVDAASLDQSELPADLRALPKDQLKGELTARASRRLEAKKAMVEVAKQRADYLAAHADASSGFDSAVNGVVERAMAKKK